MHLMFAKIISEETSVVKILHRMEKAYWDFFNAHRNYFRMLNFFQTPHFHKQVSEEMKAACAVENNDNWEVITGLLKRGVKEKKIRNDIDPTEMAIIVWSSATALMLRIDSEGELWKEFRKIDLANTLKMSNQFIIDSILTPEARLEYAAVMQAEP